MWSCSFEFQTFTSNLKPRQRSVATIEIVLFRSHLLQDAQEQVAEWLLLLAIDVLTVFESAAGENDRQVRIAVEAAASESRSEKDLSRIEQRRVVRLPGVLETLDEATEILHHESFHDGELIQFLFLLTVVGKGVKGIHHSIQSPVAVVDCHGDDSG